MSCKITTAPINIPSSVSEAAGCSSRLLSVGRILRNLPDTAHVVLQPYRAKWVRASVHVPLYQDASGHTEKVGDPVKESVP